MKESRRAIITVSMLGVAACICALALRAADSTLSEDDKIRDYLVNHRTEMVKVTPTPYRGTTTLCTMPPNMPHNPHGEHWINVFVSPGGTNAMTTGKGTYPVGTIILKQKFLEASGTYTEFYTGMRKREPGYNPDVGDWEFFTLERGGRKVTARGKIDSCMDCHASYQATDFVSRRYLTAKEGGGK